MKPVILILVIGAVAIAIMLIIALCMGFVQIPGLTLPGQDVGELSPDDEEAPPGAVYCDFTDMQILDMLETIAGKDLDNAIGVSYVRALNMQACGSDDENALDITAHYRTLYSDWYISDDAVDSGAGWTAYRVIWLNAPDASATLVRAVLIGEGITVEMAYGYDTITIVSDGPAVTYAAFMIWVASS